MVSSHKRNTRRDSLDCQRWGRRVLAGVAVLAVLSAPAVADVIILEDANSRVSIDPESQSGMLAWEVDGIAQMFQQWFWFRIDDEDHEESIDTANYVGAQTTDTNGEITGDFREDNLFMRYGTADTFWLDVEYGLTGGASGSGASDITEVITITNNGDETLDFHLFQYCDFDLSGDGSDDEVVILNGNQAIQTDPNVQISETIVTGSPDYWEANLFSLTRDKLNDGLATTLNGSGSAGPGNVTWAFQWDVSIAPGAVFQISKDKLLLIPEPGTVTILSVGLAVVLLRRRRLRPVGKARPARPVRR